MLRSLYVLCLILAILAGRSAWAEERTIHFTTDAEKRGGFLQAVTMAAFERAGYRVRIDYRPWGRALEDVMTGQTEALLGARYSDERARHMLYSKEIGKSDMVFFKRKDSPLVYRELKDLAGLTVGTITRSLYPPEFMAMENIHKEGVSDFRINIRKLLAGRIPVFVEKRHVVLSALRTEFPRDAEKIVALNPPLETVPYFNAFSRVLPGAAQKLADFNRGLELIRQDGTYDEIMSLQMHE